VRTGGATELTRKGCRSDTVSVPFTSAAAVTCSEPVAPAAAASLPSVGRPRAARPQVGLLDTSSPPRTLVSLDTEVVLQLGSFDDLQPASRGDRSSHGQRPPFRNRRPLRATEGSGADFGCPVSVSSNHRKPAPLRVFATCRHRIVAPPDSAVVCPHQSPWRGAARGSSIADHSSESIDGGGADLELSCSVVSQSPQACPHFWRLRPPVGIALSRWTPL
jgi:hypothetical protein